MTVPAQPGTLAETRCTSFTPRTPTTKSPLSYAQVRHLTTNTESTTNSPPEEKGSPVKAAFPNIRLVIGDLDSSALLEAESAKADIIIHTADASDNEPAAKAIAKGLASGHTKDNPGFWLHTGGAGILCWETMRSDDALGEASDHTYNDWTDVASLTHLPASAFHKAIDDIVLSAGSDAVKTAILCPPTIYGRGRGPVHTRSRQAYELAHFILARRCVPVVGRGAARWNNVHVADLARLFVLLVEAAVARRTDAELWNARGYYLVANGEHAWAELARRMGATAVQLGLVEGGVGGLLEERRLSKDEALEQAGFEAVSWGYNSRGSAQRAREVLGWKPTAPCIEDTLEEILKDEQRRIEKK